MVVRGMILKSISQCSRSWNFTPRQGWPSVFPAVAWKNELICGFERPHGEVLDLSDKLFLEVWKACHEDLALCELARAAAALKRWNGEFFVEIGVQLFELYGLRLNDRLTQICEAIVATPLAFQNWADSKKMSARDLAPLLTLKSVHEIEPLLHELPKMTISKFEGARTLELFVELYLMGRPLNDLLPTSENGSLYLRRLESWRRPSAAASDEEWRKTVDQWPWPSQVQAEWQRFGDQAGIEIKFRTTSPDDFQKKLERLAEIPDTWSCKN